MGNSGVNRKTQENPQFTGGFYKQVTCLRMMLEIIIHILSILAFKTKNFHYGRGNRAWEVALRASQIDLSDKDIDGGNAYSYTLGIN